MDLKAEQGLKVCASIKRVEINKRQLICSTCSLKEDVALNLLRSACGCAECESGCPKDETMPRLYEESRRHSVIPLEAYRTYFVSQR